MRFGGFERGVRRGVAARELDVDVRLGAMMTATRVACRILDDRDEDARGFVGPIAQVWGVVARDQRVQRVLHRVERVGRRRALQP